MAGVGCVEHRLHPQRDTFRPSCRPGVHEGFGTGRRKPEVLLAGKVNFTSLIQARYSDYAANNSLPSR